MILNGFLYTCLIYRGVILIQWCWYFRSRDKPGLSGEIPHQHILHVTRRSSSEEPPDSNYSRWGLLRYYYFSGFILDMHHRMALVINMEAPSPCSILGWGMFLCKIPDTYCYDNDSTGCHSGTCRNAIHWARKRTRGSLRKRGRDNHSQTPLYPTTLLSVPSLEQGWISLGVEHH